MGRSSLTSTVAQPQRHLRFAKVGWLLLIVRVFLRDEFGSRFLPYTHSFGPGHSRSRLLHQKCLESQKQGSKTLYRGPFYKGCAPIISPPPIISRSNCGKCLAWNLELLGMCFGIIGEVHMGVNYLLSSGSRYLAGSYRRPSELAGPQAEEPPARSAAVFRVAFDHHVAAAILLRVSWFCS